MAGLLDFLQAASNSAASTVSGPVDGLAWLLRKAGVPVPEDAAGSSAWMEKRGLTRPVQQSAASLAGETVGLLSPTVAAAKAPQIAKGLLQVADNAAAPSLLRNDKGAIVWHGSPHKFDKFDSSKIGTGEGAQAYGHGLYFAESPGTASSYRGALSKFDIPDGPVKAMSTLIAARGSEGERLARQAYAKDFAPKELDAAIAQAKSVVDAQSHLYKVDLPDNAIAKMLDWDKPLSQQAVPRSLANEVGSHRWNLGNMPDDPTGQQLVQALQRMGLEGRKGSERLRDAGIPGVRYLDGGSRGAGTGTSNFVVFPGEEGLLKILERNGQGL